MTDPYTLTLLALLGGCVVGVVALKVIEWWEARGL